MQRHCGVVSLVASTILVGSTGFVGSTLNQQRPFDLGVHRPTVAEIENQEASLLVCAGLPAAKYLANQQPTEDWDNVCKLAASLSTVIAKQFVLISTVDVYQPPVDVDETVPPALHGAEAYGRNRSWFEQFVAARFADFRIIRLPGLLGSGLRKNLVYDLLEGREEQWRNANGRSQFQFFNVDVLWPLIDQVLASDVRILNVSAEPITAQAVADQFDVELGSDGREVRYNMTSIHADQFGGAEGYLVSAADQLSAIQHLKQNWRSE